MALADAPIDQECVEGYLFHRPPFRLLLLRRPPSRGRIWVPVSGKVEATDADYSSALAREVREETGFGSYVRIFPLDWEVLFEGPDGARWRLHAFGVELDRAVAPVLSSEHEAFEWVTAEEALHKLHYEDNREAVRRLRDIVAASPTV